MGSVGMHLGQQSAGEVLFMCGSYSPIDILRSFPPVGCARSVHTLAVAIFYTQQIKGIHIGTSIPFLNAFDVKYGQRAI